MSSERRFSLRLTRFNTTWDSDRHWHRWGRLLLKRRFGSSLQALLRRLLDLEIINASHYRHRHIDSSRMGYRKVEPDPLLREQPLWLRRRVLRTLAEELMTKEQAERLPAERR